MKTIKTMTLSAALAAVFLSAGAFAHVSTPATTFQKANITVIHKSSNWPQLIKIGPCDLKRCVEA